MKSLRLISIAAMLAVAPAAFAGDMPKGSVAGYLTMSEVDFGGGGSDDGMGFGIRGWASVNGPWFVHGEYQTTDTDDFDITLQSLRLGGGYAGEVNSTTMWLVKGEYIDFGSDLDQAGFGVHGGMMLHPSPQLGLYGTVGYLTTDDTDGLELDLGVSFAFTKEFAGVFDYRTYMASVDPSGDIDLTDLRVGVAYMFY